MHRQRHICAAGIVGAPLVPQYRDTLSLALPGRHSIIAQSWPCSQRLHPHLFLLASILTISASSSAGPVPPSVHSAGRALVELPEEGKYSAITELSATVQSVDASPLASGSPKAINRFSVYSSIPCSPLRLSMSRSNSTYSWPQMCTPLPEIERSTAAPGNRSIRETTERRLDVSRLIYTRQRQYRKMDPRSVSTNPTS